MTSVLLFIAVGAAIGLARGGSFRNVSVDPMRALPLLYLALVLQLTANFPGPDLEWLAFAMLLGSYALLFAFAGLNLGLMGMWLVGLGALLNVIVIAANGGMPVSATALAATGFSPDEALRGKHFVDFGSARLRFLSDMIAWRLTPRIVSVGDLLVYGGLALLMVDLMKPRARVDA